MFQVVRIIVVILFFCGEVARSDESWSDFRGPNGNGVVVADAQIPLEWSRTKNVVGVVNCLATVGRAPLSETVASI